MIVEKTIVIEGKKYLIKIEFPEIIIYSGINKEDSTYEMYFKNIQGGYIGNGRFLSQAASWKDGISRGLKSLEIKEIMELSFNG